MEKNIDVNEAEVTPEETIQAENVQEGQEEQAAVEPEQESKGLSLRDSLEKSLKDIQAKEAGIESESEVKEEPKKVSRFVPPAEWNKEEKDDFLQLSEKQQQAVMRIHKSRNSKLEELKKATQEYNDAKSLAQTLTPYIKSIGVKEPTETALKKALQMWREFEEGDPREKAAAYLKVKGVPVPNELLVTPTQDDEKIIPLQNELNNIKQRIAQEDYARAAANLQQTWASFEQEKNAGGKSKYPDLDDSEKGISLAANIGSLVNGETDLSRQFIANVQSRIPDLTSNKLLAEAYKYCGGRIDETDTPRTQDTQKHILKARRASASVPGRGAQTRTDVVKKYKTTREALEAAVRNLNSD